MASTVSSAAASAASAALPHAARAAATVGAQAFPYWVRQMPTRAIAHVLLQQERHLMNHGMLYTAVDQSGLMHSHRHFKHCLRMMKEQDRVRVICNGPETPGSAKRAFSVQLTRRGAKIYSSYTEMPVPEGAEERGLKDALA